MEDVVVVVTGIITNQGIPKLEFANFIAIGMALAVLFAKELTEELGWRINITESRYWIVRHLYISVMIAYILLFGVLGGDQFIYFQF